MNENNRNGQNKKSGMEIFWLACIVTPLVGLFYLMPYLMNNMGVKYFVLAGIEVLCLIMVLICFAIDLKKKK